MRRIILLPMLACCLLTCAVASGQAAAPPKPLTFGQSVGQAIDLGKKALLKNQRPDGSWAGYGAAPSSFPVGPTALAVYALLESGMNPQAEEMKKALDWLSQNKATRTYELGLRCNAWHIANTRVAGKYRSQLNADARMLELSTKDGSYTYDSIGTPLMGDNSNSQYGLLGMWAASLSGYEVTEEYWYTVMRHWLDCQGPDGGWGYEKNKFSTGTMTAAGVASLFVCYDNLFAGSFIKCQNTADFKPVQRGLEWFDRNFDAIMAGKMPVGDMYYFFYGVERIGLASGYKYFGTSDWYKLGATRLLAAMQSGGGWSGGFGNDISTSFALLFLVRGRNAVLFNKLEFPSVGPGNKEIISDWRCRPRDLAMVTSWLSRSLESTYNWQIINLKVPVREWHDAPILYISGSLEPKLTAEDIAKLRAYVLQGGTIFSCTECDGPGTPAPFKKAIRDIYQRILPEYEMVEIPADHEIYSQSVRHALQGKPKLFMISNGVRPLVIHCDEDMPKAWQLNRTGAYLAYYQAAANIFMYVTDGGKTRTRGSHFWPDEAKPASSKESAKIVRLKWRGNWNPEPLALERFSRMFSGERQIDLKVADPVDVADVAKSGVKVAILSGTGPIKLDDSDTAALKDFVAKGGTLLVDAAGGDKRFSDAMESILDGMYGVACLRAIAGGADVYNVKIPDGKLGKEIRYRRKTIARKADISGPSLKAVILDNRPAVIFSREDISNAGLVGYQNFAVDGYDPGNNTEGSAYRVMRNIVSYALNGGTGPAGADKTPSDKQPDTAPK